MHVGHVTCMHGVFSNGCHKLSYDMMSTACQQARSTHDDSFLVDMQDSAARLNNTMLCACLQPTKQAQSYPSFVTSGMMAYLNHYPYV